MSKMKTKVIVCKSMRKTACIAKPATSKTLRKTLSGSHQRVVAVQITQACKKYLRSSRPVYNLNRQERAALLKTATEGAGNVKISERSGTQD
jgi:hypothetical protein